MTTVTDDTQTHLVGNGENVSLHAPDSCDDDSNEDDVFVKNPEGGVAFSLSEASFALFPPVEQHGGDFPKLSDPVLAGHAASQLLKTAEPYPVSSMKRGGVRGDSYAGGERARRVESPSLAPSTVAGCPHARDCDEVCRSHACPCVSE